MNEEERKEYLEFIKKKRKEMEKITSRIYYFDDNNNITDREHAVYARICEYDEFGCLIRETVGSISENEDFDVKN